MRHICRGILRAERRLVRVLVVATVVLVSCGGAQQSSSNAGGGMNEQPTPAEWSVCSSSDDCVLVMDGASYCCHTRYRGVNRAFEAQAREAYTDMDTPPELTCVDECEVPRAECEDGRCVGWPQDESDA
jgi:hypothetical protein